MDWGLGLTLQTQMKLALKCPADQGASGGNFAPCLLMSEEYKISGRDVGALRQKEMHHLDKKLKRLEYKLQKRKWIELDSCIVSRDLGIYNIKCWRSQNVKGGRQILTFCPFKALWS